MQRDSDRTERATDAREQSDEDHDALSLGPFFHLSLDLVCIAGTDGYFKRVNHAFTKVLGFEEEELLSLAFYELVHPDDRAATEAVIAGLARGKPIVRFDNRYRCADGSYRWLQWTAAPPTSDYIYAVAREITNVKLTEERLRLREQQLSEAQAIAGLGSWSWELATHTQTWSEQLYRLLGLAPFSASPSADLYLRHVHEADRARLLEVVSDAHLASYALEYRLIRADGVLRTMLAQGRTVRDDQGRPVRSVGTVQDITEQKRAEQDSQLLVQVTRDISTARDFVGALQTTLGELCRSEDWDYGEFWFPSGGENTLSCVASHARDTARLRAFRERSESMTCQQGAMMPGRVWSSGRAEWHADVSLCGDELFGRVELAREAELRNCVAVPVIVESDVAAVLVLMRGRVAPEDARQLALLSTIATQLGVLLRRKQAEDALRASEGRFQTAALATGDVMYDWDLRTNSVVFNRALEAAFGYSITETQITWWLDLIHPDDAKTVHDNLEPVLADGGARVWSGEYRFRRSDGSYANVFDRAYILRDAEGKAVRLTGSFLDLSDRVRAAEALREARDAAEAAGRFKSEFLANMSHEIRTPLTAVLGFADLLLDPKLRGSERLNYAMTIRRNGEHLLALLNDILDISKIEAGKLQLEKIECSPAQVLTDVASLMRVRAVEKGLSFEVEYTGSMPSSVRTDPTRLRQIVLNLVSNAIKFTEQGAVRVLVGCTEPDGARGTELVIAVRDTGIGISPEHQQKLFKPFEQADASMTRRYGGSGLGLGICAPLAAALGGEIRVESEPGHGSTFTLRLPIEVSAGTPLWRDPKEALTGVLDRTEPPIAQDETSTGLILLAEDGRDNQVLISRLLHKQGFEVTVVENGRLAVDAVLAAARAGRPFDVVLMDMQMPELDGYGATAALRGRGYEGSIVALTAHAMAGERERCLAAGCDAYLTKPIDRATLIRAVQEHVTRARQGRALIAPPAAQEERRPGAAPQALAALVSEFAADPEMADIVRAFVAGLPAQLEVLAEAARSADLTTLTRLSHQLKGAAGGYGFPSITEAAAKLEQAAQGGDPAQVQSALATVVALCDRTRPDCPEVVPAASEAPPALLAIDDSPQIQALIEARLRAEGITIHKALDAREGLQMTREHMPDLVLLDLDLPDGSGLDVCRELKADPHTASIPIVFLTGASDAATKAAALDLGAVDYVTKPFDAIELRARVRSALRTKRYHDLLASRAQLDGLTRLWNRAFFDGRLAEEQTSAMRHGRPLSVAMLDVDHFKRVNDTFGHPVGDQVLQRVASALRKAVRGNDVVCRYGGEEFALILRDTAQRAASDASERLRAAVAAVQLVVRGQRVAITASFGVASTDRAPERHVGLADALVGAADAALYRAKRAGRNRVVSVTIDG